MSFLLDTCVLSEETKPRPEPAVHAWMRRELTRGSFISAISLVEIEYGIQSLASGRRRRTLEAWFRSRLVPMIRPGLVAVDEEIALRCGLLVKERPNTDVRDALIAATALVHDLVVATRNVRHFAFDGLSVFNPWAK
ncbi:MAG TPA: type II toxin-antitoxin system VapC family toxin [Rhizomicrobium sp.]|nr:type II toxin-antitoxin system VapC family toxin [Rhizomicrobium sp.]